MSLPENNLDDIINEINTLNPNELEQIVVLIKDFKAKKNIKQIKKPSDFRGLWSDLDINVEDVCRKMREE